MKNLAECTLREVRDRCANQELGCNGCEFEKLCRKTSPSAWDLRDNSQIPDEGKFVFFTDEEVEFAKVLAQCFGYSVHIVNRTMGNFYLMSNVFPTLNQHKNLDVQLREIIHNKGVVPCD